MFTRRSSASSTDPGPSMTAYQPSRPAPVASGTSTAHVGTGSGGSRSRLSHGESTSYLRYRELDSELERSRVDHSRMASVSIPTKNVGYTGNRSVVGLINRLMMKVGHF